MISWTPAGGHRSADTLARREALQAVWAAGELGIDRIRLASRLGLLQSEVSALLGDRRNVVEQYEAGRGIVYYWCGKPSRRDSGRRAR